MPCSSRRWKRFPGDLNALSAPARANRSKGGRSGSARCRSNRRRGSRTAQAAESPPRSAVPDEDQHHKNGTENKERRCDGGQGLGVHQDHVFIGDLHGLEQAVSNGRHALRFFLGQSDCSSSIARTSHVGAHSPTFISTTCKLRYCNLRF